MSVTLDLSRARAAAEAGPVNLSGLSREALKAALIQAEVAPPEKARMRAGQIWRWIHHYGVTDFGAMSDIAKDTRAGLAERFVLARPEVVERLVSADGTRKWLIRFAPGVEAETVFIPDVAQSRGQGALCVSTFSPAVTARVILDNVAEAVDILADHEGIGVSRRRITVSTSGVVPEIRPLGERTGAMLAVSLHAVSDPLRDELVPINRRYPIAELMAAVKTWPGLSNAKRVTFEYVMLKGVNDTPADAKALVKLLAGVPAKINLIPFNPWPGSGYECSDRSAIEAFAAIVNRAGYAAPVRKPRGRDILAACGQLKSDSEKQRASARRRAAS